MINLLPPAGRKALRQEYFLRVGATFGFLVTVIFLFLAISLIPIYVLTRAQIQDFDLEMKKNDSSDELFKKAEKDVLLTESVLKQLKATSVIVTASSAIEEIQNNAPPSIVFKDFKLNSQNEGITGVYINGIAPTREILAKFKYDLETTRIFEKAEIPISDLARERNLPFVMLVTVAAQ